MGFVWHNTYRFNELSMPLSSHPPWTDKLNCMWQRARKLRSCLLRSFSRLHHACSRIQIRWVTLLLTEAILNYFFRPGIPIACSLSSLLFMCWNFHSNRTRRIVLGQTAHQMNYKIQRFGDQLHLHHQGDVKSLRLLLFANVSTALSCVYDCRHLALFCSYLQSRGILSHDYPAAC